MKVEQRIAIFVKKERRQPQAWELCPRADFCNINRCILHQDYSRLKNDSSDPSMIKKERCIPKTIRKSIGMHFKLPNLGLTSRELSYVSTFKNQSLSQRDKSVICPSTSIQTPTSEGDGNSRWDNMPLKTVTSRNNPPECHRMASLDILKLDESSEAKE